MATYKIQRKKNGVLEDVKIQASSVENVVTTNTTQTISGTKTFTDRPKLQESILPSDYQQVEWIASNGGQWINTGLPVHMNYHYYFDFQKSIAAGYRIWGAFNQASFDGGLNTSLTYSNGDAVRWTTNGDANQQIKEIFGTSSYDTDRHIVEIINGAVYGDGISRGTSAGHNESAVSTYNAYLFTLNPGGTTPVTNFVGKIYAYKVWDDENTLIQNFVPCYQKSNSAIGMYDTVSETFYPNSSGSGAFTKGSDTSGISNFATQDDIPTKVSAFTNDAGYLTSQSLSGYVPTSRTIANIDLTDNITANELKTALNVPTNYVTTNTSQDVTGNKTWKNVARFQYGGANGCMIIGADVGTTTLINGNRTLGRMAFPTKADKTLNCAYASLDTLYGNSVEFGGRKGDVTTTSPDYIAFTTAHTQNSLNDKTLVAGYLPTKIQFFPGGGTNVAPALNLEGKWEFNNNNTFKNNSYTYSLPDVTGTIALTSDITGKADKAVGLTGDTRGKITYNSQGIVTGGADLDIIDITGLQLELDKKQPTLKIDDTLEWFSDDTTKSIVVGSSIKRVWFDTEYEQPIGMVVPKNLHLENLTYDDGMSRLFTSGVSIHLMAANLAQAGFAQSGYGLLTFSTDGWKWVYSNVAFTDTQLSGKEVTVGWQNLDEDGYFTYPTTAEITDAQTSAMGNWCKYVDYDTLGFSTQARATIGGLAASIGDLEDEDVNLQTQINNLKNIGRFLAIFNASAGTVSSQPSGNVGDTYTYKVGDYYRVGAAGTKYPKNTLVYTIDATSGSSNFETGSESLSIGDVIYCSNVTSSTTTWVVQASSGGGTVQDVQKNGVSVLSGGIANVIVPTKVSDLTNDSGFITSASIPTNYVKTDVNTTLSNGVTTTWSTNATRKITLSGNNITMDVSAVTGGYASTFAKVKDATDTMNLLGFYGNSTSGLSHFYMGGTYSDPYFKITKAGLAKFKNTLEVPSLKKGSYTYSLPDVTGTLALTSDIPSAGITASAVSTTASGGSATTWSKSDHVHSIALETGDGNGQVKIAGTNVSVKGLGSLAYSSATIPTNTNQLTNGAGFITSSDSITGNAATATTATFATKDGLGNIIPDTYVPRARTINSKALTQNIDLTASDVGAAPTSHTHDEYVDKKLNARFYPFVCEGHGSPYYKITFPYSTNTSISAWFMTSFNLDIGGPYNSQPVARAIVSWYPTKNNSAWTAGVFSVQTIGNNLGNFKVYRDASNYGIMYLQTSNTQYNGFAITNLFAHDTAPNYDFLNTTVESIGSIPSNATEITITTYLTSHQDISGKIDTAGTGLSKTGTTLNHSNSVTAQTTQAVYPIKIDAQGHISSYGSAVTIPTKYAGSSSAGGAATSANKVNTALTFKNDGSGAASGTTFDGSTARTISYNTIGAAASSHTHSYLPLSGGTMTGNLQIGNSSNSSTAWAPQTVGITVRDLRACTPTPDFLGDRNVNWYFDEVGPSGDASWKSIMHIKGWTGSYYAWELMGPASTTTGGRLYYRDGVGSSSSNWNSLETIAFTSDIPTVTDYYWANVKVSSSSSTTTTPRFSTVNIGGGCTLQYSSVDKSLQFIFV